MNRNELKTYFNPQQQKEHCNKKKIGVCCGAGCLSSGAEAIIKKMEEHLKAANLAIEIVPTGCMGPCNQGPLVKILPDHTLYQKLKEEQIVNIIQEHLLANKPVQELLVFSDIRKNTYVDYREDPFFKSKKRLH